MTPTPFICMYGQLTTPLDLTDDALIRVASNGANISVDMASFMTTGPGRFALGSQSELVEQFFSSSVDLSWMEVGREYTKSEILVALNLSTEADRISLEQVNLADFSDDYWQ